jgi:hypothetical protein
MSDEMPAAAAAYAKKNPREAAIIEAVCSGIVPEIADFIDNRIKALRDEIKKLTSQVDELQNRPTLLDAGVWEQGKTYRAGSLVSHQGGGWIAQAETKGVRPGDGGLWRLAIKRAKERV